jgi:hypothetical protein
LSVLRTRDGLQCQGFCPALLLNKVVDYGIEDPKDRPIEKVREISDGIERSVKKLISEIDRRANDLGVENVRQE